MTDLYIGLPMLLIFLIVFSFTNAKMEAFVFLIFCICLLIPINISKKNRMYKVIGLFLIYIIKCKNFIYLKQK